MATRRSFDDSDEEEEATAIDLRSTSQAIKRSISAKPGRAPARSPEPRSRASSERLHQSEEHDEEATEFLSPRPASVRSSQGDGVPSSLRARGRAVPLEADEDPAPSRGDKRGEAGTITDPEVVPAALPQRTPRPLPPRIVSDMKSETQTGSSTGGGQKSSPRITRIFVDPDATHRQIVDDDDAVSQTDPGDGEPTDPPRPRPLPPAGKPPTIAAVSLPSGETSGKNPHHRRAKTERTRTNPSSETLEAEPADGTLIVEVPDGAVVFIDGLERGTGPSLRVKEIDRYAKHAVRIHCPGYLPWSGSVCLEGRTAAKIRPGLKKRPS